MPRARSLLGCRRCVSASAARDAKYRDGCFRLHRKEAAGDNPILNDAANRIIRISQRGLDSKTLQELKDACHAEIGDGNTIFAQCAERIARACDKGLSVLAEWRRLRDAEKLPAA